MYDGALIRAEIYNSGGTMTGEIIKLREQRRELFVDIDNLRAQRDALLAACKAFPEQPALWMSVGGQTTGRAALTPWIRAIMEWRSEVLCPALAKAQGEP
jgi:hypothetical protein